jgi:cbb3-type cytochrome oxidase maturation protein
MEALYLLIPFSALLVLAILVLFAQALRSGQFDDLDREGERILEATPPAPVDVRQASSSSAPEQLTAGNQEY